MTKITKCIFSHFLLLQISAWRITVPKAHAIDALAKKALQGVEVEAAEAVEVLVDVEGIVTSEYFYA